MPDPSYDKNVFVNCPFDEDFEPVLKAILFCLVRFGLNPRIATERTDSAENRLEKIEELIASSRYAVHDLSRAQSSRAGEFYRLNMPFELGLDYGCRKFGLEHHTRKRILVVSEKPYQYQAALSDIAGSDISVHGNDYQKAIRCVRHWLVSFGEFNNDQAGKVIGEYEDFQEWFLEKRRSEGADTQDLLDTETPELLQGMLMWVEQGRPRQ